MSALKIVESNVPDFVTFDEIMQGTAHTTFTYGSFTIKIEYAPGAITEKTLADLSTFQRQNLTEEREVMTAFSNLNENLCSIIKHWSLMQNDGKTMYPLELEWLAKLPMAFRIGLLAHLTRALDPEDLTPQEKPAS